MKLLLGPPKLETELDFTIFKTVGPFNLTNNKLGYVDKIGVYTSGGVDSTALWCLIIEELKAINKLNSTQLLAFTIAKSDGPTFYAVDVINQLKKHFNCEITHINDIVNDPIPDLTGDIGANAVQYIKKYTNNILIYMAINRMAPDEIRPFNQVLKVNYGTKKDTQSYSTPFLFLHKPQILDIYYKLGCDSLLKYTHSCTEYDVGACGKCYSCAERAWGFSALNKIDPTIEE